jgi:hypothetical protein
MSKATPSTAINNGGDFARALGVQPRPKATPSTSPEPFGWDTREVPMEAPAGTPSPLREAHYDVAHVLFLAGDLRHDPPRIRAAFEEHFRHLTAAMQKAEKSYNAAEVLLQVAADDNGNCAHREALNAACRIMDHCGHVMLRRLQGEFVSSEDAIAHVQSAPGFDPRELLKAMRRQTSRVALRTQALVTQERPAPPANDTKQGGKGKGRGAKGKKINERMLGRIQSEPESAYWTAQRWAEALGCVKSTVVGTRTWKVTISALKASERVEREMRQERNQGRSDDD